MQILIIPAEANFDLIEMGERRIRESRATLGAESQWISSTNTVFDGTYRHILGAAKKRSRTKPE